MDDSLGTPMTLETPYSWNKKTLCHRDFSVHSQLILVSRRIAQAFMFLCLFVASGAENAYELSRKWETDFGIHKFFFRVYGKFWM